MPFYEYECTHCGYQLEILQKIHDPVLTECPDCNQHKLQKLISMSSFHLKGSGWYKTGYQNTDKPAPSAPEKPDTQPKKESKKSDSTET